ncbi:MAG: GNAT family N-acetyltransferase, partial [Alphaproteobacteria bacterium]
PTTQAWVVGEDGISQGFILCQIAGDEAEILTFCVSPSARRRGAGQSLLASLLATAKQQNVSRVFLEVAADNQVALALYEKAGFRPNGKRTGYYRRGEHAVDAVMLGLDL